MPGEDLYLQLEEATTKRVLSCSVNIRTHVIQQWRLNYSKNLRKLT